MYSTTLSRRADLSPVVQATCEDGAPLSSAFSLTAELSESVLDDKPAEQQVF